MRRLSRALRVAFSPFSSQSAGKPVRADHSDSPATVLDLVAPAEGLGVGEASLVEVEVRQVVEGESEVEVATTLCGAILAS
jgi:hypothetical protein